MRFQKMLLLVTLLFMTVFLFGIAGAAETQSGIKVEDIQANFSRIKPDVGTVFMKIRNEGKTEDVLTGANINIKGVSVELHDVQNNAMVKVDKIIIPAKSTVLLKKGSFHMMLFNLPIEVKEGDELTLTLIFEKSGRKEIKVKFLSPMQHMHSH